MSYDIYLEIDTGNGHKAEVADLNYTSNVSPMWRKALQGAAIGGVQLEALYDLDGQEAADCVPALQHAIAAMNADWASYVLLNPANGWGDVEGAYGVLRTLEELCQRHPKCQVRVGH